MFDIFVYLFENYAYPAACPTRDQLIKNLSEVGFNDNEITAALRWLGELDKATTPQYQSNQSIRIYSTQERICLSDACFAFLAFLKSAEIVDLMTAEIILDRALALGTVQLSLAKFKIIVLMVLWQQQRTPDWILLEELLTSDDDEMLPFSLH